MKLAKVKVQNYRSIRDTGDINIEEIKTILVGPNEAGKTALLQAIQQINPPDGVGGFDPLRDYPRALYNDIMLGKVKPEHTPVVTAEYTLEQADIDAIDPALENVRYELIRFLNNSCSHRIIGGPARTSFGHLKDDLNRLCAHADKNVAGDDTQRPSALLQALTGEWIDQHILTDKTAKALNEWIDATVPFVSEANQTELNRVEKIRAAIAINTNRLLALNILHKRQPKFVLYSNYFRVRPSLHLRHLADRLDTGMLDDEWYDYGNNCLLRLLGFTARELSDLGQASEPDPGDPDAVKRYKDQLDRRSYQLNAASVRLTREIRSVWKPNVDKGEADKLLIRADGQYLKVVVEDDLGVEVELDQRSEGFQWLVSFFVVFFAEAADDNENAILLLDEPGLSLHALKQRDFRDTVSRLAEGNQTLYTTHSPFLVGPNELDIVRVVEMTDRTVGTKVHTTVTSSDPAALLPLQEALGYDLAQSLFATKRNLILEGLTDYWYLEAVSQMAQDAGTGINTKIALVPASSAGKVVYFATILHAQNLKVATLLDSDGAGDQAAQQDTLVHTLGHKRILRTKDYLKGAPTAAEIEDLLRETLIKVAKDDLGWDVKKTAAEQPGRPIVDIFKAEISGFSKYRLAKAFLRWARSHELGDLTADEQAQWGDLIAAINKGLK